MNSSSEIERVREVLQQFQDGYTARAMEHLDKFMGLFARDEGIEMIGIGAARRGGHEWFEGHVALREIVESDWTYWGDVRLDVRGAKISMRGETAWLSTTGTLSQSKALDTAIEFHLKDMKALFDQPELSADEKLMEVTHYGMRRLRERSKGVGYCWPFTFTSVLVWEGEGWRFHTIHWAMPVD